MPEPLPLFDAHLHPEALTDQDLESMRFFGVERALVVAHHFPEATAKGLRQHFDHLVERQLPRLERLGIRAWAALGVHPRCIPRRGLSEVLSHLPEYFEGGRVVALGETGLHVGGEEEEEAFLEQLALARQLKLRVVVHTPLKDKERHTRRILTLLRQSGLAPSRALVDHANARTVRTILEVGHWAGLTLHPEALQADRAVALVRRLGSERLVLDSDAGDGAGDILGLARTANLLGKAKLSERLVRRVTRDNAATFFQIHD
ncbi:hydrolase TatD [Corallococcus praedator]|uniref:Hydrolase TatD n=1 Tax=Corallococcus praedator TaxID=2316724 RepID=A0ABX9QGH0_9BACT|nr:MULTISPECIES: TatD family hydrolase [Corallococcus]RKH22123.1 hydrolase TatD [Corallococcus sp. CA031C]RKI05632.1 hydrolase TatD [Corallococcus praedator]